MKKNFLFLAVLLLTAVALLSACGGAVQFKLNFIVDGEVYAAIDTAGNEAIKMPENPTKEGELFDGWYWDKDTWQKPFTANSLLDAPLSSDMNVYAKWKSNKAEEATETTQSSQTPAVPAQFSVKFMVGDEVFGMVQTAGNAVVSLPQNPAKDGYDFDGWYWDNGTWQQPFTANSLLDAPLSSDMNVYAKFSLQIKRFTGLSFKDQEYVYDGTEKSLAVSGAPASATVEYAGNGQSAAGEYSVTATVSMDGYETVTMHATLKIVPDLSAAEIVSAPLFAMDGQNLSLTVSNTTESFSFINQIKVSEKAMWQISTDIYGVNAIPTKTVPLDAGDNTFYLLVTSGDTNTINLYTVTIRRRPIYTVSFNTANGTAVEAQQVEETYLATIPVSNPERTAYAFVNWEFDFTKPIMGDTVVNAVWNPITYTISYDLAGGTWGENENPNPAAYTIESDTITLAGSPKRPNYMFGGWDITTIPQGSYGDRTITAQWLTYGQVFTVSGNSITGLTEAGKKLTAIEIPNEINGVAITNIGCIEYHGASSRVYRGNVFAQCENLNAVYITDLAKWSSLSFIDRSSNPLTYAHNLYLNDELIANLTIPDDVTRIENYAFSGCSGLTSITISDSVTSIGHGAFSGCSGLTTITIPNSVTSIGNSAFSGCSGLTSVTIPNSVTSIGNSAFSGCSGLTSVTISNSVTSIGNSAFSGCSKLQYNEYGNAYYLGNANNPYVALVEATGNSITSCTIAEQTKVICSGAFSYCSLTSITIPDSVTSIGNSVFSGCSNLTSVTIGNGVTSIGVSVFSGCSGLTTIAIPDSVTSIEIHAFESCSKLQYNEYGNAYYLGNANNPYVVLIKAKNTSITSCTVAEQTKLIFASAFNGCGSLTNITVDSKNTNYHSDGDCLIDTASKTLIAGCKNSVIPTDGSVTSIGNSAFYNCNGLTSITIPDSVTSIGNSAFYNCNGLTSITIPDSVTSIGAYAFYNCSGLKSVTIGNSVTSISFRAFSGCSSLTSVTFASTSGWYYTATDNAASGTKITVDNASTNATYLKTTYTDYYWYRG